MLTAGPARRVAEPAADRLQGRWPALQSALTVPVVAVMMMTVVTIVTIVAVMPVVRLLDDTGLVYMRASRALRQGSGLGRDGTDGERETTK
jgi:hypothetical protein